MKKKLFFLLSTVLFMSCSWLETPPAEPEILGTACLKYNFEKKNYYVEIDTTTYVVTSVYAGYYPLHIGGPIRINQFANVEVTCFKLSSSSAVECMLGICSKEEIQKTLQENYTIILIFTFAFVVFVASMIYSATRSSPKQKEKL